MKFWSPLGSSFMLFVAKKASAMITIIDSHDEIIVFEMLSGPILVMISAGRITSGCGPLAMKRPRTMSARTAMRAPMTMDVSFKSVLPRRSFAHLLQERLEHSEAPDEGHCQPQQYPDQRERGLESGRGIHPSA